MALFFLGVLALLLFLNNVLFLQVICLISGSTICDPSIRSFALDHAKESIPVETSSWMLALSFAIFRNNTKFGFFNRLITTILIIWLYSKKNLRGWSLLFVVFYPSLLLYSSLALRDTLFDVYGMSVIFSSKIEDYWRY